MISLQVNCSMRHREFFLTFFLPECVKLTAHLGSKIAFVTPINPGLYYWKCMVLYMHTIAAILIVKSLAEYLNT